MKTAITLLFIFFLLPAAFSQYHEEAAPEDGFGRFNPHFTKGIPTGEFGDAMDDNAIGLGASFLINIPGTPVSAGARIDYLSFNHKKLRVTNAIGTTGFEGDYDWVTRSQALLMGAVFRLQPKHSFWLKPYGEGSAGLRRLFTNSTLSDRNSADTPNLGTDVDISDWSVYYGGALGISASLAPEVMLDLSCHFTFSPFSDFYTKTGNAGPVDDPLDAFELKHSASTNLILPQIGVSILIE